MTTRAISAVLSLTLAALASCGESGEQDIVFDTVGGVPAVLNPSRGLLGDTVPWSLVEYLRVGGDGSYDGVPTSLALDVDVLPDGAAVVLDAEHGRLLWFDADGGFVGTLASASDEPSPFENPFMLEVTDSLIYVLDIGRNQVVTFARAGDRAGTFAVDLHGLAGTIPLFEVGAADELYLAAEPFPYSRSARDTGRAVLYRMDETGTLLDTVLMHSPSTWTPLRLPDGGFSVSKTRFAPELRADAAPGLVALNYTSSYIIELRSPDGSPLRRIARSYENIEVTPAIRDSVLDRLASGPRALPREVLEVVPFAAIVPAVEGLVVDDEGGLWVDPYTPDEPLRRDVYDADGRFLGPVYLPEPVQLKTARLDRICGIVAGADRMSAGAVCYRVERPAAETSSAVTSRE